jgi:hypothetical protein
MKGMRCGLRWQLLHRKQYSQHQGKVAGLCACRCDASKLMMRSCTAEPRAQSDSSRGSLHASSSPLRPGAKQLSAPKSISASIASILKPGRPLRRCSVVVMPANPPVAQCPEPVYTDGLVDCPVAPSLRRFGTGAEPEAF